MLLSIIFDHFVTIIDESTKIDDRMTYPRRKDRGRISFTSVRRDGVLRAVAIRKSVLPDNNYIYIHLYVYTHIYVYTYMMHIIRLQSEVRTSSSFTLMFFVPDENFLPSRRITRI